MGSGLHGVPISATVAVFSNNPISGIRAPLTMDESDLEYSVSSSKSRRNSIAGSYYSNSELESEGFMSGEDEPETRPSYMADQDEDILEETHLIHEYGFYKPPVVKQTGEAVEENSFRNGNGFSRPYVRNPDGKFAQGSGNVDRYSFFRPFVRNPDQEFAQESSNVNGKSFLRPFVGNPDKRICKVISNVNYSDNSRLIFSESGDEFVENESYVSKNSGSRPLVAVIDEENLENGPTQNVDIIKVPVVQNSRIPIAKISRDSDDDDDDTLSSEVLEDEDFLGDGDEPQAEKIVEMEFVKDLVTSNGVLGLKDENEHIDVDDIIKCVISSDTVQDRGSDVNNEDKANSLSANEKYNLDEEKIQEIDATDDRKKGVDLVGRINTDLDDNFVFNQNVEREQEIEDMPPEFLGPGHLGDASPTGSCQSVFEVIKLDQETTKEAVNSEELHGEVKSSAFFVDTNVIVVETGLESIKRSHEEISLDHSQEIDCQIITDSDEPQSVGGVDNFSVESSSDDVGPTFFSERPIFDRRNCDLFLPPSFKFELEEALSEGERKKKLERIHQIRVKYSRLVHRFGCFREDSIASKIFRQLSISDGKSPSQAISIDSAWEKGDSDFSLCILVIGKTGVGKSATINSIFGENKTKVNAFEPSTTRVKEIIGNIDGVEVKVVDTPGLRISPIDQSLNRNFLSSIKKLMRKSPPDVILYVDRLDTQFNNLNDLPLLKSITSCLGSSIWRKSIVAFTHADLVPPDGPEGYPSGYEEFIDQQSRAVGQLINQSGGETNDDDSMFPVSLVENNPFAKTNGFGELWRSKLLFLCYSTKILSEVRSVVKTDNPMNNLKEFLCRILTRPVFESYDDYGNRSPAVFSIRLTNGKKDSNVNVKAGSNKKLSGTISVKIGDLDRLQITALALFPIAKAVFDKIFGEFAED